MQGQQNNRTRSESCQTSDNVKANRRIFLRSSTAAVAAASSALIVPRHVLGGPGQVAPSDQVHVALVGCGGRARQNMRGIMKHQDAVIIAVADPAERWDMRDLKIYRTFAGRAVLKDEINQHYAERFPGHQCAEYVDFREMLEKEPAIDAVVVSTPDHQHAYNAIQAMRAGKHVYCEKPLTHNIREARKVAEVTEQTGVATQMGNQGHSRDSMARTVEAIRGGLLGQIREVHAWVPTSRWNPGLVAPPSQAMAKPAGLNWDLWLGPRSHRPFHSAYAPVHWRDFWDFGCGALGDFACHDLDSATWSLNLEAPSTVEASNAGRTDPALAPYGSICRFEFDAMQTASESERPQQAVTVHWYDGGLLPDFPKPLEDKRDQYRRGVLFVGEKGWMLCKGAGGEPLIVMRDGSEPPAFPEPTIRRVGDHYRDWLDACKGGDPALSNFKYGARLTELTLLGVLAVRLGEKLEWDHQAMRVKNHPEAEQLIRGEYRSGWEV